MYFSPVQEAIAKVETLMRAQADNQHPDLQAALDLLIASGGKRVRPTITLLVGKMLGAPEEELTTLAAAIEMLHTATLVHDDLIDGSLLRRGSPTLNSKWTPAATVLTGDFMFARAAKLVADTGSIDLMKVFAMTLSTIVNGEISQLFTNRCQVDKDDYFRRIYAKTASLFETAASTAAILSGASPEVIEPIRSYGYAVGIAFQIVDDILDFTGDEAQVGKPIGNDLMQGIVTLPTIYYCDMYPDDPDGMALNAGDCLDDNQAIRLAHTIRDSKAIHRAYEEARRYVQKAVSQLSGYNDTLERRALEDIAEYIVQRSL